MASVRGGYAGIADPGPEVAIWLATAVFGEESPMYEPLLRLDPLTIRT
jgi:hypothetical protein